MKTMKNNMNQRVHAEQHRNDHVYFVTNDTFVPFNEMVSELREWGYNSTQINKLVQEFEHVK